MRTGTSQDHGRMQVTGQPRTKSTARMGWWVGWSWDRLSDRLDSETVARPRVMGHAACKAARSLVGSVTTASSGERNSGAFLQTPRACGTEAHSECGKVGTTHVMVSSAPDALKKSDTSSMSYDTDCNKTPERSPVRAGHPGCRHVLQ